MAVWNWGVCASLFLVSVSDPARPPPPLDSNLQTFVPQLLDRGSADRSVIVTAVVTTHASEGWISIRNPSNQPARKPRERNIQNADS